jgi:hypothetical protein
VRKESETWELYSLVMKRHSLRILVQTKNLVLGFEGSRGPSQKKSKRNHRFCAFPCFANNFRHSFHKKVLEKVKETIDFVPFPCFANRFGHGLHKRCWNWNRSIARKVTSFYQRVAKVKTKNRVKPENEANANATIFPFSVSLCN